ncbi:restriction endonuclease subunit S [Vibrio cyclitrophicus]|uniref:restriction endonuclease subunit S n=1 Tax=Vibrio cyclitrophicus TaxID=47951 RepID=UPI0032E3D6CF
MEKKIPEIRFKGFEGEWKQSSLGELGSVATNKRIFIHQTSLTGDVPFYKIGTFGREPKLFISQELFDDYKKRYPFPEKGDLLFSVIGSIGRVVEYAGEDEYFQDSNVVWLKHDGAIENSFLKQFYSIVEWEGIEGSTIKHLYNRTILGTKIQTPSREEQTQIGNYFQKLDTLINQHQQKHDKLSNLKKAMLEKIFPKQEKTVPEIRFDGFSGDWEEVTLGTNARFTKGRGYSKGDLVESGTPIILYGRLYTKYQTVISQVDTFSEEKPKSLKSMGAEVIVPASGESPEDIARASAVSKSGVILGGDLNVIYPNDKITPEFLALTISHGKPQKELSSKAQGKSVVHIRNSDLESLLLKMPELDEQKTIASYFQKLDELINQHNQQITKLKNIKQACLDKMFV